MTFSKIKTYSNWCEIDQLDGTDLQHGEKLKIQFPDGSEEDHFVEVRQYQSYVEDMGRGTYIPNSEAYVTLKYNGFKIRTRAVGLKAQRQK